MLPSLDDVAEVRPEGSSEAVYPRIPEPRPLVSALMRECVRNIEVMWLIHRLTEHILSRSGEMCEAENFSPRRHIRNG